MELREQLSSCLFCAILLATIPFSESFEVISSPAVMGIIGQDVVLPCQISTRTQPDNMEVQWKKIIQTHIETVYEYRAWTGQDVPGQKYQGRTVLLKDGFTSGNVSLKLKNVQSADRGTYICIVKTNEWSADVETELQIAELKNSETLREKGKKKVRFSLPETPQKSTETPENTENMVKVILGLLLSMIVIGIIFFIYYCCRKRSRDPETERLVSAEEGPGGDDSQSQRRLQKEKDELQTELKELQGERRPGVDESQSQGSLQKEKDELQVELRRLQKEKEELQGKLDWRMICKYADNITLNRDTAHPNLSIARDQKSLKHKAQPQNVSPNPERFDSTVCVLGSEGFSSGKHYWEVDVVSSTDWDLGMARKSIQRKGKLSLSPKEGFWALGLSGRDYWAKTDPWTRVLVQKKPKKIGIYLSYQDGQVTFFNVTDMSVLFIFNDCSFSGEVYPFFKNSHKETTMRICSIREDE